MIQTREIVGPLLDVTFGILFCKICKYLCILVFFLFLPQLAAGPTTLRTAATDSVCTDPVVPHREILEFDETNSAIRPDKSKRRRT